MRGRGKGNASLGQGTPSLGKGGPGRGKGNASLGTGRRGRGKGPESLGKGTAFVSTGTACLGTGIGFLCPENQNLGHPGVKHPPKPRESGPGWGRSLQGSRKAWFAPERFRHPAGVRALTAVPSGGIAPFVRSTPGSFPPTLRVGRSAAKSKGPAAAVRYRTRGASRAVDGLPETPEPRKRAGKAVPTNASRYGRLADDSRSGVSGYERA